MKIGRQKTNIDKTSTGSDSNGSANQSSPSPLTTSIVPIGSAVSPSVTAEQIKLRMLLQNIEELSQDSGITTKNRKLLNKYKNIINVVLPSTTTVTNAVSSNPIVSNFNDKIIDVLKEINQNKKLQKLLDNYAKSNSSTPVTPATTSMVSSSMGSSSSSSSSRRTTTAYKETLAMNSTVYLQSTANTSIPAASESTKPPLTKAAIEEKLRVLTRPLDWTSNVIESVSPASKCMFIIKHSKTDADLSAFDISVFQDKVSAERIPDGVEEQTYMAQAMFQAYLAGGNKATDLIPSDSIKNYPKMKEEIEKLKKAGSELETSNAAAGLSISGATLI